MEQKANNEKTGKKKSFFAGLLEKLDKKMEEKAKSKGCCCGSAKNEKDPCCS